MGFRGLMLARSRENWLRAPASTSLPANFPTLLPKETCKLARLQELLLSANLLRHVPGEIGRLRSLVKLHVNDDQLWRLPESIGCLTQLRSTNVQGNAGSPELQWTEF